MLKKFSGLQMAIDYILDTIFPIHCLSCRKQNEIVCEKCLDDITLNEITDRNYIYSSYSYKDKLMKKIIWNLKYYNKKDLGIFFGQILYRNYIEEINELRLFNLGQSVLVIPVPLSKKRQKDRGYNQAQVIANGFCNQANTDVLELQKDTVVKTRDTIPQAHIKNKRNRLNNARGVYKIINPSIVKNRNIIIIDDVTTTGGTIDEIKKLLEKAGARKVIGITIAH